MKASTDLCEKNHDEILFGRVGSELKFGRNKKVKYIKGLARRWPLLLEALPGDGAREMGQLHAANKSTRLFESVYDCCETEAGRDLRARGKEI